MGLIFRETQKERMVRSHSRARSRMETISEKRKGADGTQPYVAARSKMETKGQKNTTMAIYVGSAEKLKLTTTIEGRRDGGNESHKRQRGLERWSGGCVFC